MKKSETAGNQPADQEDQPTGIQAINTCRRRRSGIATTMMPAAEINWEYAVIERLDEHDLSTRLIPFRLADAIDNPASPDNQAAESRRCRDNFFPRRP